MGVFDLEVYAKKAAETAVYPEDGAVEYLCLGLLGESGEIAEKLKKHIRAGKQELSAADKRAMLLECGDVLWYLAMLAAEIDKNLSKGWPPERRLLPGLIYDFKSWRDRVPVGAGGLAGLVFRLHGEICGTIGRITVQQYHAAMNYVQPLAVLEKLVELLGSDLETVAAMNLEKLNKRKAAGTLAATGKREEA